MTIPITMLYVLKNFGKKPNIKIKFKIADKPEK